MAGHTTANLAGQLTVRYPPLGPVTIHGGVPRSPGAALGSTQLSGDALGLGVVVVPPSGTR